MECFPKYRILIEYDNIDDGRKKQEVHGLNDPKNARCIFCGMPFSKWGKKDTAHAISECIGNKSLINFCECFDCNHLFGESAESHLGKFIMPYRIINEIYGKGKARNVVKDESIDKSISYRTYRFEQKKNTPVLQSDIFEVYNMLIEKSGTGRLTKTENGICLSIPRQKYDPHLVYASLLKMAYTLLPQNEINHYLKAINSLYLAISLKPIYDENHNMLLQNWNESDRQKYLENLPNLGMEISILSDSMPKGVNVCLLKRNDENSSEPQILFAIQMNKQTIVIPVISDDYQTGKQLRLKCIGNKELVLRKLDFSKIEEEYKYNIPDKMIPLPKEIFPELQNILRDNNLLK